MKCISRIREKSNLLVRPVLVHCQTQHRPRSLPGSLRLAVSSYYHLSMFWLPVGSSEGTPRPDYEAMCHGIAPRHLAVTCRARASGDSS